MCVYKQLKGGIVEINCTTDAISNTWNWQGPLNDKFGGSIREYRITVTSIKPAAWAGHILLLALLELQSCIGNVNTNSGGGVREL